MHNEAENRKNDENYREFKARILVRITNLIDVPQLVDEFVRVGVPVGRRRCSYNGHREFWIISLRG